MIVPIFVIGLASSIVTEFLKLFSWFSTTDSRKRIIAFLVSIVLTVAYMFTNPELVGWDFFTLLFGAIGAAFIVYKSVIQTIITPIRARLEKKVLAEESKA